MSKGTKILTFFMMVFGKTLGAELKILERQKKRLQLQQVYSEDECDVVLAFVPIVSRAGTDIEAALEKIPTHRPVVLVIIHNTFDPDHVVPDSKYCVRRDNVLAVDFLHYENTGLLQSQKNDMSSKEITDYLISLGASTTKFTSSVTWKQLERWNSQPCVQYMINNVGITPEKAIFIGVLLFFVFMSYQLLY